MEAERLGLQPKKYLVARKKMETCWSIKEQFTNRSGKQVLSRFNVSLLMCLFLWALELMLIHLTQPASENVNAVSTWMRANWASTVNEVASLAVWRYQGFSPSFERVEEAFLLNDGDVEQTLAFIAPQQVRRGVSACKKVRFRLVSCCLSLHVLFDIH